jgi:hypothetical protein
MTYWAKNTYFFFFWPKRFLQLFALQKRSLQVFESTFNTDSAARIAIGFTVSSNKINQILKLVFH